MTKQAHSQTDEAAPGHSALMDKIYERQIAIYDLTRRYYLVGRNHLITEMASRQPGTILEVGCGTGRNLLLAGRKCPDARLFGFDISNAMLAKSRIALKDMNAEVVFGDAQDFDAKKAFGTVGFDAVFLSYSLSMIPDWKAAIDNAMKQVSAGGSLYIADFALMEGWPRLARRAMSKWLTAFHVTPRAELIGTCTQLAQANGFTAHSQAFLGGYATYVRLDRNS